MGGAMLEGWLAVGLDPRGITVLDPKPSPEMATLCTQRGIALNPADLIAAPEVVVLATKPQTLDDAAPAVDRLLGPRTLLVSILAGKTIRDLRARLPRAGAIVRAMPNLPASIGRGATGAAASPEVAEDQRRIADLLLRSVGIVEWLPSEDLVDAVTALSGSGPAYVFLLAECLAEAGAAAGLPPELAQRLARATVTGAGELLARSDLPPSRLRENVTSPGGTTAAALQVLMAEPGGLKGLMREAVAAAKRRGAELSG
jgi:pyrroline-5-carboxylate reductase